MRERSRNSNRLPLKMEWRWSLFVLPKINTNWILLIFRNPKCRSVIRTESSGNWENCRNKTWIWWNLCKYWRWVLSQRLRRRKNKLRSWRWEAGTCRMTTSRFTRWNCRRRRLRGCKFRKRENSCTKSCMSRGKDLLGILRNARTILSYCSSIFSKLKESLISTSRWIRRKLRSWNCFNNKIICSQNSYSCRVYPPLWRIGQKILWISMKPSRLPILCLSPARYPIEVFILMWILTIFFRVRLTNLIWLKNWRRLKNHINRSYSI